MFDFFENFDFEAKRYLETEVVEDCYTSRIHDSDYAIIEEELVRFADNIIHEYKMIA